MITNLIFPRWLWPNNLGDSLVFCIFPQLLKKIEPKLVLHVVTHGTLVPLLEKSNSVDSVANNSSYFYNDYPAFAFSKYNRIGNRVLFLYPENHPDLYSTIKTRFDEFVKHDSINFIVLNYLLQLGLVEEGFNLHNFYNFDSKDKIQKNNKKIKVAICPITKLNGKTTPHPGCNGLGFRFNGVRGLESWAKVVTILKSNFDIEIYEFSPINYNLGDYYIGVQNSLYDLYLKALDIDYAITNDGGMHHLFNLCQTPLTLFTGTKVTKPEFMQLGNAYVPDIHLECRKTCASFYSEVFGVEDKSQTCKLECEYINPIKLTNLIAIDIQKRVYEK